MLFNSFTKKSTTDLFHHLTVLGANLEAAAIRFEAMVDNWDEREQRFYLIRETEHEGDRLLRDLQGWLKETFFVPGDREGIYALTNEMDDVVDKMLKIANYLLLYRIETPSPTFIEMVKLLRGCCTHLKEALSLMVSRSNRALIEEHCLQVIQLEDEADRVHRRGLEQIFDNPQDLTALLKWKDVLDMMDDAVDHTNHVANMLMALNGNLH
jgi:predicted phosphate transport protein (TIGR00153 family)